jgi:tyrosyl-tRNA synthetase
MWRYYDLLSFRTNDEIARFKEEVAGGRNPRDVKVMLAQEIVARFHSRQAAEEALADFEARFKQGAIPEDIDNVGIACGAEGMGIAQVLRQAGLTGSTSEALRMIEQGGVRLDGEKVSDRALVLKSGTTVVLQVGKRKFARISLS